MLALWILLGLCAFLALLLLLPLHIYLAFTPEAGFSFYARYAFLTIRPGSGPNEKLMEQIFTLLGLRDVSSTANARSAVSAKGVAATLCELGAVLRTLLGRVFWLLHRGTFRRFSLHIAVGAGDPPMRRWTTAWCARRCIPCLGCCSPLSVSAGRTSP